jgi:hypothetical protein
MWRAFNLTSFTHSSTGPVVQPVCFPSRGTWVQSPGGYLCETGILIVLLHWWPWRDWSLWPRLSRALSQTITRQSCRQCDNPTWSHTVLLSRFMLAAGPPYGFPADIVSCWGGGGGSCNLTASHTVPLVQWSTRFPPVMRDPGSIPRGVLMWNQDSPVSVVSLQTVHLFPLPVFSS